MIDAAARLELRAARHLSDRGTHLLGVELRFLRSSTRVDRMVEVPGAPGFVAGAIVEDAVMTVRKSVEEGKTISEPLAETKVFPPMVVQMINVGEQTGALDQMLSKIADFYEDEVDTAVAGLMKLMEPVMIAVLGAVIGTIVAAMYLPLYSVLSKIG